MAASDKDMAEGVESSALSLTTISPRHNLLQACPGTLAMPAIWPNKTFMATRFPSSENRAGRSQMAGMDQASSARGICQRRPADIAGIDQLPARPCTFQLP